MEIKPSLDPYIRGKPRRKGAKKAAARGSKGKGKKNPKKMRNKEAMKATADFGAKN